MPGRIRSACFRLAAAVVLSFVAIIWPVTTLAQNIQYTQNVADTTLRSRFRVDPSTLGLSLQIPLGNHPGRGGAQLPITLYYSAKVWNVNYVETRTDVNDRPIYNILEPAYGQHSVAGWTCSLTTPTIEWTGYQNETYEFGISNSCEPPPTTKPCDYISRIRVYLPDGSSHELRKDDVPRNARQPYDKTGTFLSVDGSRLRFESSSRTLYLPDGSRYIFAAEAFNEQAATQYIDRNGNTLAYNSTARQWTDSLGRPIGIPLPVDPALGGVSYGYDPNRPTVADRFYDIPGVENTTLRYTLRWKRMSDALTVPGQQLAYRADHIFANGNPRPAGPYLFVTAPGALGREHDEDPFASGNGVGNRLAASDELFNPVVLAEIVLPNQISYKFTYNIYGEIDKVIYPTGGYERYVHGRIAGTSYLKPIYGQANRGVVDHYLSPSGAGTDESRWQYSSAYSSTNSTYTVTVSPPDGSRTERLLHGSRPSGSIKYGFDDVRAGMAYEEKSFSASNQMLRRTLTEWTSDGPTSGGDPTAQRNQRVLKQVEIVLDTGGDALWKATSYQYDQDLNVSSTSQYDFVSVDQTIGQTSSIDSFVPSSPLRTIETTYLVNDTSIASSVRAEYRTRQLIALPTLIVIRNSVNTKMSETKMIYDETGLLTYGAVTGWIDPATPRRGNLTTTRQWVNITDTYLETHTQCDQLGNPRITTDARGNQSQIEYASANAYAYPTLVKTPVPDQNGTSGSTSALETTNVFDYWTGLLTSTTDPNAQPTTFTYGDPLNRLKTITRPSGGGSTTITYNDVPGNFYVRTQTAQDAAHSTDEYQFFDGLGRAARRYESEGSTYIVAETQYDSMLRTWRVSNPYRSDQFNGAIPANVEWTTSLYDALGRVISVTTPDTAVVSTAYSGTRVLVTDQAGKQRISKTNALGQLSDVWEIRSTDSSTEAVTFPGHAEVTAGYRTSYQYDALDNLITVSQSAQSRRFAYDSLKRLIFAANPEQDTSNDPLFTYNSQQWAVKYEYDENSNLKFKTDTRVNASSQFVKVSYVYDALNRVTSQSYNDGTPTVTYKYDGMGVSSGVAYSKGKPTQVSSSVSTYSYDEYDQMGRVKACTQTTDGHDYHFSYTYDLAGEMLTEVYPSGRTITNAYDVAGRLTSVNGQKTGEADKAYATGISYAAHGALASMTLGNNLIEKTEFNSRLQPTFIKLGTTSNPTSVLQLGCGYETAGQHNNNGNVLTQTIAAPGLNVTQTYGYDALNRLTSASENGSPAWSQNYGYDRYGNRWVSQSTGHVPDATLCPTQQSHISATTNRLVMSGFSYDAAGNQKAQTRNQQNESYDYDAENRLVKINSGSVGQYSYDGDGRRVKKTDSNGTTIFVYNVGGQLIAEYHSDPVPPAAGGGGTSYLTTDHLGSTRVVTNSTGGVKARYDYLPFGEEIPSTLGGRGNVAGYVSADSTKQKFTQKERDNESGLDYFGARYFASSQGRFTGADPYDINFERQGTRDPEEADAVFSNYIAQPQHWNHYSYALNNPLKYVDPDGLLEYESVLLGQKIKVKISDSIDKKEQEIIKKKIDDGIALINKGADALTKKQQDIIKNIKGIVVRDDVTRSGTNLQTGIFTIVKTPDLIYSKDNPSYPSASWVAAIIIHDSFHPDQFKRGLSFSGDKNGAAREREANQFAADVGALIGLDSDTVQTMRNYAKDPGTRFKEPFKTSPRSRPPRRKTP